MRIARALIIACSLNLMTGAIAEDQARTFEYLPSAHLVSAGQYRAEVWRRELATNTSDLAWSNNELAPSAAKAKAEACAALQANFDQAFSCAQAPPGGNKS